MQKVRKFIYCILVIVILALVSIPSALAQWEVQLGWIDKYRSTNDQSFEIIIGGRGFAYVSDVTLESIDGQYEESLDFDMISYNYKIKAYVPENFPAGHYALCLYRWGVWADACHFMVDPPLPVVTSVIPNSAPSDEPVSILIEGSHFTDEYAGDATAFYLEGDNDQIVPIQNAEVLNDSTIQGFVSADLAPCDYRIRIITAGGISVDTVEFQVCPPVNPFPFVESIDPPIGWKQYDNLITIQGNNFINGSSASTELVMRGDSEFTLQQFIVQDNNTIIAIVPSGMPEDHYDLIVRTPAGENKASLMKYISFDLSTYPDYMLDDTSVTRVNANTVLFNVSDYFTAIVERGRLRYLYSFITDRTLLSEVGGAERNLGLEWDSLDTCAFEGNGTTDLSLMVPNRIDHGVDFVFDYMGEEAFRVTWSTDLEDSALQLSLSYDTNSATLPGNVYRAHLGSIGVPPDYHHLIPASGGLDLDWHDLLNKNTDETDSRIFDYPDRYMYPLIIISDPNGGGLLVDMEAFVNQNDFITYYSQAYDDEAASGHATLVTPIIYTHKDSLKTGDLGPIRFVPTDQAWPEVVEPFEEEVYNPYKPSWHQTLSFEFGPLGIGHAGDLFNEESLDFLFEELYPPESQPTLPDNFRLLFTQGATETWTLDLPDWYLTEKFHTLGEAYQADGWRVIPYMATPGVNWTHPIYSDWQEFRLSRWNRGDQELEYFGFDFKNSGEIGDDPNDYWCMNVAFGDYRAYILNETQREMMETFDFDGIYFDWMKSNINLTDRNPNIGDATDGYVWMVQEFYDAFSSNPNGFAIAGEDATLATTEAGNFLGHMIPVRHEDVEKGLLYASLPIPCLHPIGSYLLADETRLTMTHLHGMPAWWEANHYTSRLACVILGGYPKAAARVNDDWYPVCFHEWGRRGMLQLAEEGLYWSFHNVKPWTDPDDPRWLDPDVLRLYEVDGIVVAFTKDWFLRKLVCDLYWQFGGRAPTAVELEDLVGRTRCNTIGVFAATHEIRAKFQQNPTAPENIQTRWDARDNILAIFPEYPVP